MQQLPCGFGEQPFIFPEDLQINSLKQQSCESSTPCCQQSSVPAPCCKQQSVPIAIPPKTKLCFKCKVSPSSILYKGQSMCKACSLRNVEYKCRVNLQNKIKINEKDKIIACLSGGMNSICLVNILYELQKKFQKHLLFGGLQVVHVDLSVLNQDGKEYKERVMRRLERFCKERELKLNVISLQEMVKEQQLKTILNNFRDGANQSDIIDIFIERLITQHYPEQLIAYGTSGQRTASNILKFIVKGQGGSLQQISWKSQNKILPLREHLTKQLQFYYYMNKLDQYLVQPPSLFSKEFKGINTINNILQDFIDGLQDTYSHTCPTILRTSEKIKKNEKGKRCVFCEGYLNGDEEKLCLRCVRLKEYGKGNIGEILPKGYPL